VGTAGLIAHFFEAVSIICYQYIRIHSIQDRLEPGFQLLCVFSG
jgi:hypothetical protein